MLAFNAFTGKGFSVPKSLTHAVVGPLMGVIEEAVAAPSIPIPPNPIPQRDLTAAYDILSTPANALDAAALSQLLVEEGIIAAVDLGAATAEEVQHLAACLRKMPRRRFLEAMAIPAPAAV